MKLTITTWLVLLAGGISAQPFEITSSTIDGGGGTLAGGSCTLTGTIGQPDAGETLSSGSFELRGGFWQNAGPTRLCADQNSDGLVTPADFNAWILAFNQGATGPLCPG